MLVLFSHKQLILGTDGFTAINKTSVACVWPRKKVINPLNTKRRPLSLKTQFVPSSKHFSSQL